MNVSQSKPRDNDGLPEVSVEEIMDGAPLCARMHMSVETVSESMAERDVFAMPVLDDTDRCVGLVSASDLLRALHGRWDYSDLGVVLSHDELSDEEGLVGFHEMPAPLTASDVMRTDIFAVPPSCGVRRAAQLMANHDLAGLAVVGGDGHVLGLVTASAALRSLVRPRPVSGVMPAVKPIAVGDDVVDGRSTDCLLRRERLGLLTSFAMGVSRELDDALDFTRLSLGRLLTFERSRSPHTPSRLHRIELLEDVRTGFLGIGAIRDQLDTFAGALEESNDPVDLTSVLDTATRIAQSRLQHRAHVVCDYAGLPAVVGHANVYKQLFVELLANAGRAIAERSTRDKAISLKGRADGNGRVVVEISHSSVGVPSSRLRELFDPFLDGASLGVMVARDVVGRFGGTLDVTAAANDVTTIRAVLPTMPQDVSSAKPARQTRVMVVDDDPPVAQAVALELTSYEVTVVSSGQAALDVLQRDDAFDVVLCDVSMPQMTGIDLYEAVEARHPALASRFVFMTGGGLTERTRAFLDHVTNARIAKPFYGDTLHCLIEAVAKNGN